jgi:hypothetical protein
MTTLGLVEVVFIALGEKIQIETLLSAENREE